MGNMGKSPSFECKYNVIVVNRITEITDAPNVQVQVSFLYRQTSVEFACQNRQGPVTLQGTITYPKLTLLTIITRLKLMYLYVFIRFSLLLAQYFLSSPFNILASESYSHRKFHNRRHPLRILLH